jgi:hypothetical protein
MEDRMTLYEYTIAGLSMYTIGKIRELPRPYGVALEVRYWDDTVIVKSHNKENLTLWSADVEMKFFGNTFNPQYIEEVQLGIHGL